MVVIVAVAAFWAVKSWVVLESVVVIVSGIVGIVGPAVVAADEAVKSWVVLWTVVAVAAEYAVVGIVNFD